MFVTFYQGWGSGFKQFWNAAAKNVRYLEPEPEICSGPTPLHRTNNVKTSSSEPPRWSLVENNGLEFQCRQVLVDGGKKLKKGCY